MKRLLAILLTISLLSGMWVFSASAAEETGTCGDNLTWTYSNYTLTINGTGPMYDYSEENPAPWGDKQGLINYIDIQEGVTRIGDYAFARTGLAEKTFVANTVTEVGSRAFRATYYQGQITFAGEAPNFAHDALYGTTVPIYYYSNWDPSVLQNYGGTPVWTQKRLSLSQNKKLYTLNEEIEIDDFSFSASGRCDNKPYQYIPKEFAVGDYDNTTYGQKYVELIIEGKSYDVEYFVTDGQNHLDLIEVRHPIYVERFQSCRVDVIVGDRRLIEGQEYEKTYINGPTYGYAPRFKITGKGIFEGYEKICSYAVIKPDFTEAYIPVTSHTFTGLPIYPHVSVLHSNSVLTEGTDFALVYENNVNVGTGIVRVIGMGDYCGSIEREFQINMLEETFVLPGAYNGKSDETLNDQIYYTEAVIAPGVFTGKVDCGYIHTAYYELYRIDGNAPVLITSKQTESSYASSTTFTYDFTSVYENATEAGGEIYMLAYSWEDKYNQVYTGVLVLLIPAKVSEATSVNLEVVEGTADYNKVYLDFYGIDGNVDDVVWTTTDSAVATVERGVVTLKTPGVVTITGQLAGTMASHTITVKQLDLADSIFFKYDKVTSTGYATYNDMPLNDGVDFISSAVVQGNVVEVTLTGTGLFTGQLVRQFDAQTGEAVGDVHRFDNSCDETCNVCDYTRAVEHDPAGAWKKNQTHHWHPCSICGQRATEAEEHIISAEDENLCTVCGTICLTGDADGDGEVTDWDGVMLARYLAGWPVEVELAALDVDGDGEVTDWDGVIMDRYLAGWNVTIG